MHPQCLYHVRFSKIKQRVSVNLIAAELASIGLELRVRFEPHFDVFTCPLGNVLCAHNQSCHFSKSVELLQRSPGLARVAHSCWLVQHTHSFFPYKSMLGLLLLIEILINKLGSFVGSVLRECHLWRRSIVDRLLGILQVFICIDSVRVLNSLSWSLMPILPFFDTNWSIREE